MTTDMGGDYHSSARAGRNQSWMWSDEEPQAWKNDGACAKRPDVDFFPGRGNGPEIEKAKQVCNGIPGELPRCPVRDECRAYGLHEHFGVWGGWSERQRRQERRQLGEPLELPVPVPKVKKKRVRRREIGEHGTLGSYNAGCRCGECKERNAEYRARRRKAS